MTPAIVAKRMGRVSTSASIASRARASELAAAGHDIVDLTVGEPDTDSPSHVVSAAHSAALGGDTRYPPIAGTTALLEAIRAKFARENSIDYARSEIVVGNGSKHVIFHALAASIDDGDEVIIPTPCWVSYFDVVRFSGGIPIGIECYAKHGFKLTSKALEDAIGPRTRWLILNNPNNPTGAVYKINELKLLGSVLERYPHVWVLSDEIYEHYVYSRALHTSFAACMPTLRQRTLTVNGVSKTYGMTGWRIGYAGGPSPLIDAISTLMSQSTGGACSISQAAAVAALGGPQEWVAATGRDFKRRRDLMMRRLTEIAHLACLPPEGAFYVFPDCRAYLNTVSPDGYNIVTDQDLCSYLLEVAHVAVVHGGAYGSPGHLRLSFSTTDERIILGCNRIAAALSNLKPRMVVT
ncbi:pyridoxal phosphate-dependent aminotransferase [Trinickia sp. NRRL B-1857]|uniref:pyridoxal phosphate-dependent aminotransferase n=1 Tax=Trinickia sp. NRRL B-1857 TaxID=3162879 RepID=UPI003D28E7ED